jgi:hypothetical protein
LDSRAKMEYLLKTVFCVRSVPRPRTCSGERLRLRWVAFESWSVSHARTAMTEARGRLHNLAKGVRPPLEAVTRRLVKTVT